MGSGLCLFLVLGLLEACLAGTGMGSDAVTVAGAGWRHSVVLAEDGGLRAWGEGRVGQLGSGHFATVDEPVAVVGPDGEGRLTGIVSVAAGQFHNLAIHEDGTVWAWGMNHFGQLGNGEWGLDANRAVPVQVLGIGGEGRLQGVKQVVAGWDHSVALLEDGSVVAWGSRCHAQLGDGERDSNRWSVHPVRVKGTGGEGALAGVVSLSGGAHHTIALLEGGGAVAWGSNHEGQLGRGHLGDAGRVHRLSLELRWQPPSVGLWRIALAYTYTDPSHLDNTDRLELVDEFDGPPLEVVAGAVEAGRQSGDFVRREGNVSMRGSLDYPSRAQVGEEIVLHLPEILIGQHEGDNDYADHLHLILTHLDSDEEEHLNTRDALARQLALPAPVVGPGGRGTLDGIVAVAAGTYHTLALREDGSVWSWGYNGTGQLGHGTRESVGGSDDLHLAAPAPMIGGAQGGVGLTDIVAVSAGYETSYALDSEGQAWSCGWNVYGGLGMGALPTRSYNRARMQRVSRLSDDGETEQVEGFTAIAAGAYHALALGADGALVGWGHNGFGQLGDSTRQDRHHVVETGNTAADAAVLAARPPAVGPAPPSPAVAPHFTDPDPDAPDVHDVRDHGAKGDGVYLDQEALQAAIDAAHDAGGGIVLVPAGVYRTGALELKSEVRLHLSEGATLFGSNNRDHYEVRTMIHAENAQNIAITGSGTIDGNGMFAPNRGWRHNLIRTHRCENVIVEGIATNNAGSWTQHYTLTRGLTLRNLTLNSVRPGRNNDGLDFTGCEDVLIEGCVIASDDDCIVIKSNHRDHVNRNIRAVGNVIYAYASGFKLGTETRGTFENILCDGLYAYGGTTLALYSVDGSDISEVTVRKVRAEASRCALGIRLGARLRDSYWRDSGEPEPGSLEKVTVSDVDIELQEVGWREVLLAHGIENAEIAHQLRVRPVEPSFVSGLPAHPIRQVVIENLRLVHPGGGTGDDAPAEVPERPEAYPAAGMFGPLPASALYLRHAEGVTLRKLDLQLLNPDARPALVNENLADDELVIEDFTSGVR